MQRIRIDDAVIERALAGDAAAVDGIVRTLQGPFFDLARRMVLDSGDAEDAAQEALLRVVTHLAQFDPDDDHRAAYVLGDILELDGEEAAEVLGIQPAAYRKRLSRARSRIAGALRPGPPGAVAPGVRVSPRPASSARREAAPSRRDGGGATSPARRGSPAPGPRRRATGTTGRSRRTFSSTAYGRPPRPR